MVNSEIRSFINQVQSWFSQAKSANSDETLVAPPSDIIDQLNRAIQQQCISTTFRTTIRDTATSAIEQWQQDFNAPNSLVVVASPAEPIAKILTESWLSEEWQGLQTVTLLPGAKRPIQIAEIVPQLQAEIEKLPHAPANLEHSSEDLLSDALKVRQTVVVVPCITQYFLRHIHGWDGIELLQDQVVQDKSRFWLLGCNSWAWPFLDCVCHISAYLEQQHSLIALDGDDLQSWLKPITDMVTNNSENEDDSETKAQVQSAFWDSLAVMSSGISSTAAKLWLQSLRVQSQELTQDITTTPNSSPIVSEQLTVEVALNLQQTNPILPSLPNLMAIDRYLLHSLLIHGNMRRSHLALSLGETERIIRSRTQILIRAGVIWEDGEYLAVNPTHYPRLKTELSNNNFLVGEC